MFITLLYVSAFMFFISDRKIKNASMAGIFMLISASLPFSWRTLFYGYRVLRFAGQFIPDIDQYNRNLLCVVFAVLVSLLFTAVLMPIAKMWSRDLFGNSSNELKSSKAAKRIFIAASVIPGIVALWLYGYRYIFFADGAPQAAAFPFSLFDNLGTYFYFVKPFIYVSRIKNLELIRTANTAYVVLLLVHSILCLIMVNRKRLGNKKVPDPQKGSGLAFPAFAITVSLSGIITFLTIAQMGYFHWSSSCRLFIPIVPIYYSYIFGSYDEKTGQFGPRGHYVLCLAVLGVMAAGIIILLISMIYMAARKLVRRNLFSFLFSIILIIILAGCIYLMLAEAAKFYSIRSYPHSIFEAIFLMLK